MKITYISLVGSIPMGAIKIKEIRMNSLKQTIKIVWQKDKLAWIFILGNLSGCIITTFLIMALI